MNIEYYNNVTKHTNNIARPNLQEFKWDILYLEKIKSCIISKRNLFALRSDRLICSIFKYCQDKPAKLFRTIIEMMMNTHRCSVGSEAEKMNPENWKQITLMEVIYRIVFGIIVKYG